MSSIPRRPNFASRAVFLVLVSSLAVVAPLASAAERGDGARVFSFDPWSQVVDTWSSVLDFVFAPSGYQLDPNGEVSNDSEPAPPVPTEGSGTSEVPRS